MKPVDWSKANWSDRDIIIAIALNCCRAAVHYARRRMNERGSAEPRKKFNWADTDWSMSVIEIAKAKGCSRQAVYRNKPLQPHPEAPIE